jgi:hypothetical protein
MAYSKSLSNQSDGVMAGMADLLSIDCVRDIETWGARETHHRGRYACGTAPIARSAKSSTRAWACLRLWRSSGV